MAFPIHTEQALACQQNNRFSVYMRCGCRSHMFLQCAKSIFQSHYARTIQEKQTCTIKPCCQIKQGICVYLYTDELQYFSYILFLKSSTHFKVQNYRNISPALHKFSHFLNNISHHDHLNPDHREKEKTGGGEIFSKV